MTREELERRLDEAEKQNLGLLDEIKWLKEKLESRLEEAEKQNLGLHDEIQNLKAKLEEQGKQEIPDFPEFNRGDFVYKMNSCFDVMGEHHGGGKGDKDFTGDDALFYNDFHTPDYALEFRRRCLMIAMMLHCKWYLDRDYVPDWESDTNIGKCYVIFDHCVNRFQVRTCYVEEGADVYFRTEEAAQKCADWMNVHWKESTGELKIG